MCGHVSGVLCCDDAVLVCCECKVRVSICVNVQHIHSTNRAGHAIYDLANKADTSVMGSTGEERRSINHHYLIPQVPSLREVMLYLMQRCNDQILGRMLCSKMFSMQERKLVFPQFV